MSIKHILSSVLLTVSMLVFPQAYASSSSFAGNALEPSTEYADWSAAALEQAEIDFPNAAVTDFLFVGCKPLSESAMNFIYKFWLRQGPDEFGAYVSVTVNVPAHKVVHSVVERTDSELPSYGIWRTRAEQAVLERYPGAGIIDYRPYECKWLSEDLAKQTYLFWLEHHGKELFVSASVNYNIKTEKIINVDISASKQPFFVRR